MSEDQHSIEVATKQKKDLQFDTPNEIVTKSLMQLTTEITGGNKPTASVKLPNPDELTVQLINVAQFNHLDELRNDLNTHQSILFIIIGAIIGFITNIITSNQPIDKSAWLYLILLCGFAAVFGGLTWKFSKRTRELRERILNDKSNGKSEA